MMCRTAYHVPRPGGGGEYLTVVIRELSNAEPVWAAPFDTSPASKAKPLRSTSLSHLSLLSMLVTGP
ncbi:hypothetical protein ABIB99_005360 [Bradyrhizobium sp. LA6.1]